MGWFVVPDQAGESSTTDDVVADENARGQRSAVAPANVFKSAPPPAAPGGNVDFDKVFDAAGIMADARERVTRTLELLNSLPPDTEPTVKKQIVLASLKAFGVPIEKIIETGAQEIQSLEGYIRAGADDTSKVAQEAEQRVKQYEEEIVKLRRVMQERVEEQQAVIRSCNTRKLEVQKVLEFFGQDAVAKVVRDSPHLHEPAPGQS